MQIQADIRAYLASQFGKDRVGALSDQDSLLEAGVIDSVAMVDLITHLEQTYGMTADEDDLTPDNFESIDAIARYVESRRRAKGAVPGG